MPERLKKHVLFVDDEERVHMYTRRIADGMGLAHTHAYGPDEARAHLEKAVKQIGESLRKARERRDAESDPEKKEALSGQADELERRLKRPYDAMVLDVNMPAGHPTGMKLLAEVRKKYPNMSVVMHSDDTDNLRRAKEEHKALEAEKMHIFPEATAACLKAGLIRATGDYPDVPSRMALERDARRLKGGALKEPRYEHPEIREFADRYLRPSLDFEELDRYRKILYDFVLAGDLSPEDYKYLMTQREPPPFLW